MNETESTDTERIINALSPRQTQSISEISDVTQLDHAVVEQEILKLVYSSRVTYDLEGDYRLSRRFCSVACEVKHDHLKDDARDAARADRECEL